ncbi:hypothetical protein ACP70R_031015 [Stipagrostis hirtigluma subsp. patula]
MIALAYINGIVAARRIEDFATSLQVAPNRTDMSAPKRHLYLVLEDWEQGYTIRKIDVDSFEAAGASDGAGLDSMDPAPLPDPPVFRVEAEHGHAALFTAVGTRILAVHRSAGAGVPVFDTATLALAVAPHPPPGDALVYCPTLVAVGGDRVYGLDCASYGDRAPRRFEALHAPAPPRRRQWSWSAVPAPPPFNPLFVACHAVHPDGRTVFFSVDVDPLGPAKKQSSGTFSFDTKRLEWNYHGGWMLPFRGQAHFDGELNAWVGLGGGGHGDAGVDSHVHVCCCDVVAPGRSRNKPPPPATLKLGAELLFCDDKKRHVGAALVYLGESRFCLLECVKAKAGKTKKNQEQGSHLLHVTAFGLKYGRKGELTTAMRRRGRSYVVPEEAANILGNPVAFWL